MGQDEVEFVRRIYDALNRRDLEGALQHLDPAVEWTMSERFSRTTRVFRGHEGIREAVALFDEALEGFRVEPATLHDAGGAVIAELRASGGLRGTGEVTAYELVNVLTLRGGRVVTVDVYPTLDEARAAAGITPPSRSSASISSPGTGRENR